jgi:hypothetical protein
LSESDLDTAYQQGLFVAQEVAEDASTTQFTAVRAAGMLSGTSLSNFASEEIVSDATNGLIDGTNAVFTITAFSPQTEVAEAYRVSIDGAMQSPTDAYTISKPLSQITFTSAPPVGSKIVVVTAASAASAVSVDDVTIGLTSVNKAEIKDASVTNAKLAGSITQDKLAGLSITNAELAGSITQDKLAGLSVTNAELAGSITTSKLAEFIDDDAMTTGVSATSIASSESIKAYVDSKTVELSAPTASGLTGTASSDGFLTIQINRAYYKPYSYSPDQYWGGLCTAVVDGHTYKAAVPSDTSAAVAGQNGFANINVPIRSGASWVITLTNFSAQAPITANVEFHAL